MRPTVHDIARQAGVSLATVDRVLNDRPGVREGTVARVRAAVAQLGYVRDASAANLARRRTYRFAVVLPQGSGQFVDALRRALSAAAAAQIAERVSVRMVDAPAQDPHAIVRTLRTLNAARLDGVAIMAPETPQVRDAVARLKSAGLAVVTLVSDLPNAPRDHFVGVNSLAAGRTAALLTGRFTGGRGAVLVATNALGSRDSLERRLGFDQVVASDFPGLTALPTVESFDDPRRMEDVVRASAARRDLVGVYSMGAGNGALLGALRRSGRLADLVVVAHELTPATRGALAQGEIAAVIAQNVGHVARSAIRVLRALCDGTPIFAAQEHIRLEVVLRENIPPDRF